MTGGKPGPGANVTVPAGWALLLDESPPALGSLVVLGSLRFDPLQDITLTAAAVMVLAGVSFVFLAAQQLAAAALGSTCRALLAQMLSRLIPLQVPLCLYPTKYTPRHTHHATHVPTQGLLAAGSTASPHPTVARVLLTGSPSDQGFILPPLEAAMAGPGYPAGSNIGSKVRRRRQSGHHQGCYDDRRGESTPVLRSCIPTHAHLLGRSILASVCANLSIRLSTCRSCWWRPAAG